MITGQILDFNTARRQGEATPGAVDADDIRNRLHANPRAFVEWLYSGRAFIQRNIARIGNVYGEPGASLSIQLQGPDAGLWKDHATHEGGDLIALYRAWAGYHGTSNFVLSIKEIAKDFFGDAVEIERSQWQPTAIERIETQKGKLGTKPREDMVELGAPVATYRYYDTRGNVIASVVRFEPDGTRDSKTFRPYCYRTVNNTTKWVAGAPDLRPLYRLPDIALSQTVVLCEGEGCADALAKLGIPATSAMQGAHAPIEKTDWSPLAGKTVVIWPDNDSPGLDYAKRAASQLSALGCKVLGITPPADVSAGWDAADCVADGRDAAAIIATATTVSAAQPKPRVRLLAISELSNLAPPEWLIDGIITVNGLSMIWGRSGSLKSFAALDKALCIATGMEWHGRPVKKGSVVYLAAEGARGLAARAVGWLKTRGKNLPEPDFRIIPHSLTLADTADLDALIEAIKEIQVSFIVVDTLSRTFGNGNPNQPSDMNAFVAACDRLREATGAHVMVVHHGGKDTEKNELGTEALRNASDTVIHIRRKTTTVELINEAPKGKQKDFDEFKTIHLRPVKVSYQQDDKELSTLILNSDDGTPAAGEPLEDDETEDTAPRLGQIEKSILSALEKAARSDRKHLGFISLHASVGGDRGSFGRALRKLVEKNLVEEFVDDTDPEKTRKNYARLK